MRVAFDTTAMLASRSKKIGINHEAYDVLEKTISKNPQDEFFCINLYNSLLERDWENKYDNFKEIDIYTGVRIEIIRMPKYKRIFGRIIRDFILENEIDVFIATDPFNPIVSTYDMEWFCNAYTATMIYSQSLVMNKDEAFFSRNIQRKYQEALKLVENVDKVFVTSKEVKDSLLLQVNGVNGGLVTGCEQLDFSEVRKLIIPSREIKKLAIFSPLPPIQSGIADYIVPLIEKFSKRFDVDIFIDNAYEVECSLPDNVSVYRHYEFVERAKEYDEILYEIGNSSYHVYMFDYVREFPGVVDLHDCNLHSIVYTMADLFEKEGAGQRFCNYLQWIGEDMSEAEANRQICLRNSHHMSGTLAENIINAFVVNYAKKIIVHNEWSRKVLMKKDVGRYVDVVPHFSYIRDFVVEKDKAVRMISVFGHMGPSKRPVPIMKAFKKLIMEGYDLKLVFVGKVHMDIDKLIEAYNNDPVMSNRIVVCGYVSEEKFYDYMEETDIVMNLRYPYNGESSGVLARAIGMGKCVIVNDVGVFSELPNNVCIKIPNVEELSAKEEINQIYLAIKKALDPELRMKIKKESYVYAKKELNIDLTAERYVNSMECKEHKLIDSEEIRRFLKNDRSFGGWV